MIWAILTAIFWGLTMASTERVVEHVNIKTYLFFSCVISAVLFLGLGLADHSLIKDISKENKGVGWIVLSSLAAFVASYCSVSAVKYSGASVSSLIECSYPLTTIIFCYLLSGKNNLSASTIIGGTCIVLGTIIVARR